ncbi:MAG: amino acid permease [Pirellulaceae bacterium]|nr:amino acid permease [Pirellulaceae bacterium]
MKNAELTTRPSRHEPNQRRGNASDSNGFLGTFGGVFTPCTLTILGVIMFLRYGQVVGQSGLFYALLIVAVSKLITTITTFSLSAISTNTKVEGGGAYFLISRSLGVEFGGAIGVIFFFAQAISVALYVIGFSEAWIATFGNSVEMWVVASIVNAIVFGCVLIGAGWTVRVQYFILGALALSLISFFWGAFQDFQPTRLAENWYPNFQGTNSFATMFALFFPAVTGIMAGANMSGDLKDPGRSIPVGTLWAIFVTAIIYTAMAIMMAGTRSSEALVGDNLIVSDIARWPILITIGVFAATLSSALGSMMGAPRILQALARDKIFKSLKFFGVGSGANNEPRRAIVLTFVLSQIAILLADLDTIAPLITMCFMITYGLINLATFYESITKNPSFRPRFRYSHWATSLSGALGCIAVMLLIDWKWALVSVVIMSGIHNWIGRRQIEARWGDVNSGLLFQRTRRNLLKLEGELYHPKNWRPIVLALSGATWERPHLAVYGHWLTNGHGILLLGQVIHGDVENRFDRIQGQEDILNGFVKKQGLEAFPSVVATHTLSEGIESLVQCQGFGALRPNTVMVGWPSNVERAEMFGSTLRTISAFNRSIVAVRLSEEVSESDPWKTGDGTIDVWWRGQKNGELMLLLAHLFTMNDEWRNRPIRLLRVIENEAGYDEVKSHLDELISSARIDATSRVVVSGRARAAIAEESKYSALTILGFEPPEEGSEAAFYEVMDVLAKGTSRAIFVSSAGNMSLKS